MQRELEVELVRAAQRGDKAATEQLLLAIRPFAYKLARANQRMAGWLVEDLRSAADEGTLQGILRHDVNRGTALVTTCKYWVKLCVHDVVTRDMWRGGSGQCVERKRMWTFRYLWWKANGDVNAFCESIRQRGIKMSQAHASSVASMFEGAHVTDVDVPGVEPDQEAKLAQAEAETEVNRLLACLDERTRYIIEQTVVHGWTNRQVAQALGLSHERVRQERESGMKRLHKLAQSARSEK